MKNTGPKRPDNDPGGAECLRINGADNSGPQTFADHCARSGKLPDLNQAVYFFSAFGKRPREVLKKLAVASRMDHLFTCKIARRYFFLCAKRMTFWKNASGSDEKILTMGCGVAQKAVG